MPPSRSVKYGMPNKHGDNPIGDIFLEEVVDHKVPKAVERLLLPLDSMGFDKSRKPLAHIMAVPVLNPFQLRKNPALHI